MKSRLFLSVVWLGFISLPTHAQANCPWAGGEYRFSDHGIYGEFSVNGDCTELVWDRLSEPENTSLQVGDNGWFGELSKVAVVLLSDGDYVQVTAYGGISRKSKTMRTN